MKHMSIAAALALGALPDAYQIGNRTKAGDEIARVTRSALESLAQQREHFCAQHLDMAATHALATYPSQEYRDGNTTWYEQRVALLPHHSENTSWPWERVIAEDLPHERLRYGLTMAPPPEPDIEPIVASVMAKAEGRRARRRYKRLGQVEPKA